MGDINWIDLTKKIFHVKGCRKIEFENEEFEFVAFGDLNERIGFMIIWNVKTKKAIRISRMKIPENMIFYDFNEEQYNNIIPEDLVYVCLLYTSDAADD